MSDKMYTVLDIAQHVLKKYVVNKSYQASFQKKIRKIIKKYGIEPVGKKKSQTVNNGKVTNDALAYSEDAKNFIINMAFPYLRERSDISSIKSLKSESEYIEMANELHNQYQDQEMQRIEKERYGQQDQPRPYDDITIKSKIFVSKKEEFISEALYSLFFLEGSLNSKDANSKGVNSKDLDNEIKLVSDLVNLFQPEFLRKKIFERHFKFNEESLVEDLNEMNHIELEVSGKDVRINEIIQNWRNYIQPK